MGLVELILKRSKRSYSMVQKLVATIVGPAIFVFLIPWGLIALAGILEHSLSIPRFNFELANEIIGAILIVGGLGFAGWTVLTQFFIGKGTPVPIVPTQKFIVSGPYKFCRNPMVMGWIAYCFGLSVWLGSLVMVVLTFIVWGLGAIYVKSVEEKELELRFGEDYKKYRDEMPMFIPRIRSKGLAPNK